MTARPAGALALDLLAAAHADLTTGEALMPEQQDSIANAVADAEADLSALIAERDTLAAQRDAAVRERDALIYRSEAAEKDADMWRGQYAERMSSLAAASDDAEQMALVLLEMYRMEAYSDKSVAKALAAHRKALAAYRKGVASIARKDGLK